MECTVPTPSPHLASARLSRYGPFMLLLSLMLFIGTVLPVAAPEQMTAPATPEAASAVHALASGEIDRTGYIKGVYITYAALGHPEFVSHIQNLIETTELNAIVMDFKGDQGYLSFPSQVALAHEIGADQGAVVQDPAAFLGWFQQRNVYTIARIVVFKDNLLAAAYPEWAVTDATTGGVWHDPEGMGWVDPNSVDAWSYNIELANEAASLGFDEIQFDYVRFPTDGSVGDASFRAPNTQEYRTAAIAGLLRNAHQALQPQGVKLGADVFGFTAWIEGDLGIGQQIERVAPYVDVLSPMIYPSTFATGLPGEDKLYSTAIAYPYEVVHKSMVRFVARARAINPTIEIRPWLQDFQDYAFDGRIYTPAEIRRQIDGARAGGGRGWMLWDAAVQYTPAALVSAQPAYTPNPAGKMLVLAYRDVSATTEAPSNSPEGRTPDQFRADLTRLLAAGFYPVNLQEMVAGKLSMVPAGKRPIVLAFMDSTPTQFRLLEDGTVDPTCAVGILLAFNAEHPADWPLRATFFVKQAAGNPTESLFGAEGAALQKLQRLVDWGMEVAAQPTSDERLSHLTADQVQEALGSAQAQLESWLPDYRVSSLALPTISYPRELSLLKQGAHNGAPYAYTAVTIPTGRLTDTPQGARFDPYRIGRVPITENTLDKWVREADRPGAYYVSPGE